MIDYLTSFEFSSLMAIFLYWIPLVVCGSVYLFECVGEYRDDVKRSEKKFYSPNLTIGVIAWRFLLTVVPCVNLIAMVFDCMSSVFKWLGKFLDVPLVPKKEGHDHDN